jgi:hypothetical protein
MLNCTELAPIEGGCNSVGLTEIVSMGVAR